MDYYRYLEFSDKHGIIPVQNGKNLTLNMPVTSTVTGAKGVKADCVTDGVSLESSAFFQKEFQYSNRYSIYTDCRYAEKCPHLRD